MLDRPLRELQGIWLEVKLYAKRTPWIYWAGKRLKGGIGLCSRNTDLCVEGYPSSANSFTFVLLRRLRPDLKIAHHCHSIANIRIALRHAIPTIVLIRRPADAVSSRMVRFGIGADSALREYSDLYRFVLANIPRLFLLTFDEITRDTEASLNRIQHAIRIEFEYDDLDGVVEEVFQEIEAWQKEHRPSSSAISLPRAERRRQADILKPQIMRSGYYREAEDLWRRLSSFSVLLAPAECERV